MLFLKVKKNSESVMDGFVEHPFYTATLNGQKYVHDKTKDRQLLERFNCRR
ncbi:hypothetical protein ACVXZZ_00325 [Staphylococcus aureus]